MTVVSLPSKALRLQPLTGLRITDIVGIREVPPAAFDSDGRHVEDLGPVKLSEKVA
jgi:hypothetical protein